MADRIREPRSTAAMSAAASTTRSDFILATYTPGRRQLKT